MTRRNHSHSALHRRRWALRGVALVAGLILGILLVTSLFFDQMGVTNYLAMRKHAEQLEQEIRDAQAENAALRSEIHRVQQDPARIEELARERLGYVRPNETVYQVVPGSDGQNRSE